MQASNPCAGPSRRRRLPTLGAAVTLVVVGSAVAAAPASAAAIAVVEPCVVDAGGAAPMVVGGTGFTPGDVIDVQAPNDAAFGYSTADAAGNLAITMNAPVLGTVDPKVQQFTLTATDQTNPLAVAPTATFLVANLAVVTQPREAKPTKRVTWSFSGFVAGKAIYAHYLHRGKVVATRSFGRDVGPCGTLKKKALFYPGHAKYSSYSIQVDNSRRYSKKTLPRVLSTLTTNIPL